MDIANVLVDEYYSGAIRPVQIPHIISLLDHNERKSREAAVDVLLELSERGKVSNFSLDIANVPLAECREAIKPVIPQIIALLNDGIDERWKSTEDSKSSNFVS